MSEEKDPIIIKKKKGGGHGHHGGAWKIAYADFVTAMMAFFLLMWLLNATSEEQKKGIANYFSPVSVFEQKGYSGGAMGSQMASIEGAFDGRGPPERNLAPVPGSFGPEARKDPGDDDHSGDNEELKEAESRKDIDSDRDLAEDGFADVSQREALKAYKKIEEEEFESAQQELKQAIKEDVELSGMINHLMVEKTEEGLRIQLIDQEGQEMFPSGSARMNEFTSKLLEKVAQVIVKLDKQILIAGHTDSSQYKGLNYSNWELSTDRANASRRTLVRSGVPSNLIKKVVGHADNDPLLPQNPTAPNNRRISITLLKDTAQEALLKQQRGIETNPQTNTEATPQLPLPLNKAMMLTAIKIRKQHLKQSQKRAKKLILLSSLLAFKILFHEACDL